MAQRSARRDRDNQCATPYLEYAAVIWDPVRELPYRPAAVRCRTRGRTDGSIRPRATTVLKFPLARKGASTDGSIRPRATTVLKFPLARKGPSRDGAGGRKAWRNGRRDGIGITSVHHRASSTRL